MPSAKLTSRTVDAAAPAASRYIIFDTELRGFGLRVTSNGVKSWVVEYRPLGSAGSAPKKRYTIGSAAVLTPTKARDRAKDILAGIRQGVDPLAVREAERKAVTVKELATAFLKSIRKTRKASTLDFYDRALRLHVLPTLGTKKAPAITRADLRRLHNSIKPVMANRVLAIVASMYAWGGKQDLVPNGLKPTADIERNAESGRERFLSMGELERLGKALVEAETIGLPWNADRAGPKAKHLAADEKQRTVLSPHAVAAIRLLILTGCRLREILHLRWSEVDFERGMLHLPDSKTGRKSVILNAPALQVLSEVPRIGEFVIAGRERDGEERPRSDLKKPWQAIRRAAGLDDVRIHDLRHSFASVGAGGGFGLPIVGKLLGHKLARTTERYAHLDNDPLRKASNAIGATIAAAMKGERKSDVTELPRKRRSRSRG